MSANLIFYHYKEPLRKVTGGHGYYGAILGTRDGNGIQCHECGGIFRALMPHIRHNHNLSAKKYRDKYGLANQTAIVCETYRKEAIDRSRARWEAMKPSEKKEQSEIAANALRTYYRKNGFKAHRMSLETMNKRGVCPDQLLDKIQQVKKMIGHTPSRREFVNTLGTQRFIEPIFRIYGSWTNAVKMAGLKPKQRQAASKIRRYSRDELLEYLRIYYQENQRPPSASDCRRGLLPYQEVYQYHFGSFDNARREAGILEKPNGRWKK